MIRDSKFEHLNFRFEAMWDKLWNEPKAYGTPIGNYLSSFLEGDHLSIVKGHLKIAEIDKNANVTLIIPNGYWSSAHSNGWSAIFDKPLVFSTSIQTKANGIKRRLVYYNQPGNSGERGTRRSVRASERIGVRVQGENVVDMVCADAPVEVIEDRGKYRAFNKRLKQFASVLRTQSRMNAVPMFGSKDLSWWQRKHYHKVALFKYHPIERWEPEIQNFAKQRQKYHRKHYKTPEEKNRLEGHVVLNGPTLTREMCKIVQDWIKHGNNGHTDAIWAAIKLAASNSPNYYDSDHEYHAYLINSMYKRVQQEFLRTECVTIGKPMQPSLLNDEVNRTC